uniref:NADH-ubiquinone oxidoreductase chain 2 n=1 Tax=Paralimna concors TaxID=2818145 RepID=A0A8A2H828_9MUSC|nr:NADH dehydrogenase subunit 2 [Paralimna concors]QSV37198.1 NADH dehydrogenase subunit 2 [Paralimna concors]
MFNNSSKIMFLMILMTGTLIAISANSWLGAWMGLEINLLSFIPLMSDNNILSSEASLKYFLTQALASAILLFSVILLLLNSNLNFEPNNSFISMMILSSLLLKSGAAPFHFWFPNLMEGLSWNNSLILMTWQKLAPLSLISYFMNNWLLLISIIASVTIGSLGGLNQTSLRKLMAFSSINHLGWMMTAMQINQSIWLIYFLLYCLLTFNMIYYFNLFKISHLNQLFSMYFISKPMKFFMFFNLLSLGGLPPFLGFFPKWMVIQYIVMNSQLMLLLILMMTALITLYFYIRICYSAFMLNYLENNFMNNMLVNKFTMNSYLILSFISIFGMIFLPMFFFI